MSQGNASTIIHPSAPALKLINGKMDPLFNCISGMVGLDKYVITK